MPNQYGSSTSATEKTIRERRGRNSIKRKKGVFSVQQERDRKKTAHETDTRDKTNGMEKQGDWALSYRAGAAQQKKETSLDERRCRKRTRDRPTREARP